MRRFFKNSSYASFRKSCRMESFGFKERLIQSPRKMPSFCQKLGIFLTTIPPNFTL